MPVVSREKNVVLITGAAQRLGRALALDFARCGWRVGVHTHRSLAAAQDTVAEIATAGGHAVVLEADLATPDGPAHLLDSCLHALGAPVCLVNNASHFLYDDIATLEPAQWDAHQAINLRAPVFLAKAFARHLPADAHGTIINILDQRVWKPTPHFLSYAVTKAALFEATRMLAQALAPRIRVNAIGPGPMLRSVHQSEADFAAQTAATILGRGTTPAEIADAIRFILDAPAMTGQMIALDGGQHLAWATPDIGDGRG